MFEYFYYRLYIMYKKKEKGISIFSATMAISMIHICILFSLVVTIKLTFNGFLSEQLEYLKSIDRNNLKFAIVIITFLLLGFEYLYFRIRHQKIIAKYSKHSANKWFDPWMMYLFVAIILVIPFFYWKFLIFLGAR